MAFLKFTSIFVVAVFLCQNVVCSDVNADTNGLPVTLAKLLTKFTTTFDKILQQAMSFTTSSSKDGLAHFQKQTVDFTFKALGLIKKLLDKELDHAQPNLNADAKKVTKCLEDNGQEIINVLVSYYNSTTICFNPVLSKVIVSAQPILDHLDKADKKIGGYAPVLEKCANDLCVFGVLRNLLVDLSAAQDSVVQDFPGMWNNLKTLRNTALECGKKEIAPWEQKSNALFNKIATCFRS